MQLKKLLDINFMKLESSFDIIGGYYQASYDFGNDSVKILLIDQEQEDRKKKIVDTGCIVKFANNDFSKREVFTRQITMTFENLLIFLKNNTNLNLEDKKFDLFLFFYNKDREGDDLNTLIKNIK